MPAPPLLLDPLDALLIGPDPTSLRVGLAVPTSGVMGLTGPAAIAAAALATEEINEAGGVLDRPIELVPIDAGTTPEDVAGQVRSLVAAEAIEALVGFHTSDIHRRLERVTSARVPYLFTPPHEGGSRLRGVFLLGEGPREQLLPAARALAGRPGGRRWALIGNDYIWPRAVHAVAAPMLGSHGGDIVLVDEVPFGQVDPDLLLSRIAAARADAVLLSLVGRDLAVFNRAFAASALAGRVVRVCSALDETGLLEIDGDDSGDLFTTMRWYASDPQGMELRERYQRRWGNRAPSLGVYAAGCYEGVHHLARLAATHPLRLAAAADSAAYPIEPGQPRLARADGLELLPIA